MYRRKGQVIFRLGCKLCNDKLLRLSAEFFLSVSYLVSSFKTSYALCKERSPNRRQPPLLHTLVSSSLCLVSGQNT